MFNKNQEQYLIRAINNNEVILFLGSGFPRLSKNQLGEKLPLATDLAKKLWGFLEYEGSYDNTSLDQLFDIFVEKGIKRKKKMEFLEQNLLVESFSDKYELIKKCLWYKIYTTNIDNLLDNIYADNEIDKIVYPNEEFKDRNILLDKILQIYLHGKLPCDPKDLIFSNTQYVDEKIDINYLYTQFVVEYITKPVIFLGTSLNEPLIDYYLRARNKKSRFSEKRPKSFLISPKASPVKIDNLSKYNVDFVRASTEDFLDWIELNKNNFNTKEEIINKYYPSLFNNHALKHNKISSHDLNEFFKAFRSISLPIHIEQNYRSGFLMGATPEWKDIQLELDIERSVQDEILVKLNQQSEKKTMSMLLVRGSAGTGKSTLLKRLAFLLTQDGYKCYFSYSEYMPDQNVIFNVLENTEGNTVLFFDNAENILKYLQYYVDTFAQLKNPPIIILGIRSYYLHYISPTLNEVMDVLQFDLDQLTKDEIVQIIDKLDEHGRLGKLKGETQYVREKIFERKAKKQLLVAMKEATSGRNFDEIIKDEYSSLPDINSKLLYICISLNTELGYTVSIRDIVSFIDIIPNEALDIINNRLKGIVKSAGSRDDKYLIRHRVIAEYVLDHCADNKLLCRAYKCVLTTLAPELKYHESSKRKFTLYKRLINHQKLYKRFKNDISLARDVYESVRIHFQNDYHYWLQYGSLETEGIGGDFSLAENYLNQADSISPNNKFISTSLANLFYKVANTENDYRESFKYKTLADEKIKSIIEYAANEDPYSVHIYCRGNLNWILNKDLPNDEKLKALKELEDMANFYSEMHPFDARLEQMSQKIKRNKLHIASKSIQKDITDDDIEYDVGLQND